MHALCESRDDSLWEVHHRPRATDRETEAERLSNQVHGTRLLQTPNEVAQSHLLKSSKVENGGAHAQRPDLGSKSKFDLSSGTTGVGQP